MPAPLQTWATAHWGGINVRDQSDALIMRSHVQVQGGWQQVPGIGLESPISLNMDFESDGIRIRRGSATFTDYTATIQAVNAADEIIDFKYWRNPATGADIDVVFSKYSIYTTQSGSLVQLDNANGTAFLWPVVTTKGTILFLSGHVLCLPDQSNRIAVYRLGTGLDDFLGNNTTTTTVDADSASGQKVLSVALTTSFVVGDRIAITAATATVSVDSDSAAGQKVLNIGSTGTFIVGSGVTIESVHVLNAVDSDSAAGQKVLNIQSTTGFAVGDSVIINEDGAREETGIIASIDAGVSITLVDNLESTHPAAQSDIVEADRDETGTVDTIQDDVSLTLVANLTFAHTQAQADAVTLTPGTGRDETGYVASIDAGVSITLEDNLTNPHTLAQADVVQVENKWKEAHDTSIANAVTGDWALGTFLGTTIHDRLLFSAGAAFYEYTPMAHETSSGIWNLGADEAGAAFTDGRITMMATFSPTEDETDAVAYVGSTGGMRARTGYQDYDRHRDVHDETPLNHKAWCKSQNWVIYLTRDKNILAINGSLVLDIGARLRASDGTGPLDGMDVDQSETFAVGHYDEKRQQARFWFSTSGSFVNDRVIVVDFSEGEPERNEPETVWERRVRLLKWEYLNPADNEGYTAVMTRPSGVIGARRGGETFTLDSGLNDFNGIAINGQHRVPAFTAGLNAAVYLKQWLRLDLTTRSVGAWTMRGNIFLNRNPNPSTVFTFGQANAGAFFLGSSRLGDALKPGGAVAFFHRVARRSESISFELVTDSYDTDLGQEYVWHNASLTYQVGALNR